MPPVLAVLDNKANFKGILAERWIIRSMLDPSKTKAGTLTRPAPKVALNDHLSKVSRLMIESEIRQLPIYRDSELLGFITDENIIHKAVTEKWGETKVEDIMTKEPFYVEEKESIGTVISLFRDQDISHAPIVKKRKVNRFNKHTRYH